MTKRTFPPALAAAILLSAALACSTGDLGIGRRSSDQATTATPPVFATTTPGGVVSVWLVPPSGADAPTQPPAEGASEGAAIVAPVGTATAAAAIVLTATAEAAVPVSQATYQPSECPMPRNPQPPGRPATFTQYPDAIAQYLSAGGPTTLLEGALRTWGAITDEGGLVKVDTDVTGDGGAEVIITVYDPAYPDRDPQPGQLFIFGCEDGGYRQFYASTQDPNISLPILLRVGDMNGDARAEVVFKVQHCTQPGDCIGEAQILTWNANLGNFQPLNAGLISAPNAEFTIGDVDEDGVLELSVISTSAGTGPSRATTQIWDWNGQNYLLALTQTAPAQYRIHILHDADAALAAGNFPDARAAYNRVLTDESLFPWTLPNERAYLNAYALYRLMLTYTLQHNDARAQATFERLTTQYSSGLPGASYAELARAFWEEYTRTRNISTACAVARSAAAGRPGVLSILNSYGTANRQYTNHDICPY